MERTINSHIQIPRFILKNFEDDKNSLYQLDVKSMAIRRGHAKTLNTQKGYYSNDTEALLEKLMESPFSKLLIPLRQHDFDTAYYTVPKDFEKAVKRFICMLISRSPQMYKVIYDKSELLPFVFVADEDKPDIPVRVALSNDYSNIFDEYLVTFAVNKSSVSFVLPLSATYGVKVWGSSLILFPVAPDFAIVLVHREIAKKFLEGSSMKVLLFEHDTVVRRTNLMALKSQQALNYHEMLGYSWVVSNSAETLKQLVLDYKEGL